MVFGTVDLIVLAVIIISVIFAFYRGLLRELLGITSWILAGLGALWSYEPFLKFFTGRIEKVQMGTIAATAIVALIILIVMTLINAHITGKLRRSSLSGLDRILGAAFGVLRAALLIVLAWMFMRQMMFTTQKIQEMKKENVSIPYMNQGADWMEKLLPDSLQKEMKTPPKKEVKLELPQYSDKDREKLDEMIEAIVEVDTDE
ncbi:MAG: CvpA family protein [Alphaproteobacteria bacterium]